MHPVGLSFQFFYPLALPVQPRLRLDQVRLGIDGVPFV